jgi:hypothetical protein
VLVDLGVSVGLSVLVGVRIFVSVEMIVYVGIDKVGVVVCIDDELHAVNKPANKNKLAL